jgi:CheY-like chemotaxis protein
MTRKILLIDDDPDDRGLFCEAVTEIAPEITCFTAQDGKRALARLQESEPDLPDMIFLDINMPGWNGWECLLKLKAHELYRDIPVIMYSTSSSEADRKKAYDYGAMSFFTKPPSYEGLKTSMRVVIKNLNNSGTKAITFVSSNQQLVAI